MKRTRFGHPEYGICVWLVGFFCTLCIFFMNPPMIVMVLIGLSWFFGIIGVCWLPYVVAKNQLRPGIDRCRPGETTWLRVTKDHIFAPQFVDKGPYGQTKGITYKEKADVIDDGAFPIRWMNGNPGILMYDNMNTSIDLNKSVARKIMKQKHGVRTGIEAYNLAKEKKEVLYPERLENKPE